MLTKLGQRFTDVFTKLMPSSFVFALLLTLITGSIAMIFIGSGPMDVVRAWYDGFFDLLAFGMQIALIVITGHSIAISPMVGRLIDKLAQFVGTPKQVYFFVMIVGSLLCLVSFGWVIITAVLARELALRVKGVHYPFLVACVYLSWSSWVCGLSSSIPLLLNTKKNFLIEAGILSNVIETNLTLGSSLNIVMLVFFLVLVPLMILFLVPRLQQPMELSNELSSSKNTKEQSIKEEADSYKLPFRALSDSLNNSQVLQLLIGLMGLSYIINYFYKNGFDLNFNIMIFIFIIIGLLIHKTPLRYTIAMKRSSSNISGILFQYPFYAGIMGIMIHTGLGSRIAELMASVATIDTYPMFSYFTGGLMNFAIPSAGGEFAVVGPSVLGAVAEIGAGLPEAEVTQMLSRAAMSIAYGESLSNLMQPFFLLLVFPVMGQGVKLQARDVMGYLVIPFLLLMVVQISLVTYL
ncbi:short-chain fatty acid transporter [Winogradskyella aurantiaca]|uniref:short-chain fatty acid transporter n=1 Tax=Winogradskyella aurantiaca TaxID=2219558 RepID=UPI000E1CD530|nr:TIGR00366 family protein [Winogradskyella aurantiaca]